MAMATKALTIPADVVARSSFPRDPARRDFLNTAALMFATGAALSALPLPAVAGDDVAVLLAIENHRQAVAAEIAAIHHASELDDELPSDATKSQIIGWELSVVHGDDPRWIAAQSALMSAGDARDETAIALLNTMPATLAGLLSLIRYCIEAEITDSNMWPQEVIGDDDSATSFHVELLRLITKAMQGFNGGAR